MTDVKSHKFVINPVYYNIFNEYSYNVLLEHMLFCQI